MEQQPLQSTSYSLAASVPTQPDRRGGDRFLRLLRVGAIVVDGRRELCLIRNISAGGMMIRTYSPVPVGARLSIELKQGDPVDGTVQWIEDDLAGVAFDAPIDIVTLLAPPGSGPRPRLPRIEIDSLGWVRQDGEIVRARVQNISQGGVCITAATPLIVGEDAVVTLPGLSPAAGVVKWASSDVYGIGFNRPLALPELVDWLRGQQQEHRSKAAG